MPIGGWYGNGRKAGWVSPFLLASWDPETETLATVCRCMSGFTDVFYAEVRIEGPLSKRWPLPCLDEQTLNAHSSMSPDAAASAPDLHLCV